LRKTFSCGKFILANSLPDLDCLLVDRTQRRRARALSAQQDDVADRQNEFGSGRPDTKGKRRPKHPQGNSRALILRRLREHHPELHRLVCSGELSPHQAAIAAGFRRQPGRRPKRPVDPLALSSAQQEELWLGASDAGSSFASEQDRRRLWFEHRDRLMGWWGCHGKRPIAWWLYEAPDDLDYPGPDLERSTLYEADLLTESEKAELLAQWRHEFDRAWRPDFFHCTGSEFLEGEAARAAHFRWCDLPPSLLEEWTAERRQQRKEKLPSEVAEEPKLA
jgi:hypothetical protein